MIGVRVGVQTGVKAGEAIGANANEIGPDGSSDPLAGVTRDATSGKYVPANAAEWATVMSVAGISSGGPSLLWLCQEATGNLADSIDAATGTLTGGPPLYRQTIAGWSRLGIAGTDAATGIFTTTSVNLPDLTAASQFILFYAIPNSAPAAARVMSDLGAVTRTSLILLTTPALRCDAGSISDGTNNPTGAVRPIIMQHDFTNNRAAVFTDQDKILASRRATTGKSMRLQLSYSGAMLYATSFFNAAAELTNTQIKTLLQTLGWTPTWTP